MLSKEYDFQSVESFVQRIWSEKKSFETNATLGKKFVISLPPPNITGRLHMGHALNNTLQDFLIRYKRMLGYQSLWIPGMDHAGIATQSIVKRSLKHQGIDFTKLSKEDFLKYVWTWKKKYGDTIYQQMQKMGTSCAFEKSRFTMDEGFSKSVLFAFDRLYKDGLIYKGKRIVNWCPLDKTALSDDEVDRREGGESGFLWSILYKFPKKENGVVVATTRPETLFGDVAIAVHPDDNRYKKYIGEKVLVPISGKEIPIIGDPYVESNFGTGCLKVTPGHDPNDFLIGKKHMLPLINIMNDDATMNENVPPTYQNLSREICRKNILIELKDRKQLVAEEKKNIPIARSYRSGAIIEYRVSDQWFVKIKPLVEKLLPKLDDLKFIPSSWGGVHLRWLENMDDWCISRQIFWGHQIPVWKNRKTEKIIVDKKIPNEVLKNPNEWEQEKDVLDTWFSSALWPMANLGWPEKTPDFERFFPNEAVFTGKDIIFFWIARMCLFSSYFENKLPFKTVFVHPTIADEKGQSMSKSKGNGIDPIHVIQGASLHALESVVLDANPHNAKQILLELQKRHPQGIQGVGSDALRFTLLKLFNSNQEIRISFQDFTSIGRKFVIKFWNAARFVLERLNDLNSFSSIDTKKSLYGADICIDWVLHRYNLYIENLHKNCHTMNFTKLGDIYHQFIWNDFCDWFLEISKIKLRKNDLQLQKIYAETLLFLMTGVMQSLHPITPFITEYIWNQFQDFLQKRNIFHKYKDIELTKTNFPQIIENNDYLEKRSLEFEHIIKLILNIRSIRSDYELGKKIVNVYFFTESNEIKDIFLSQKLTIDEFAKICLLEGDLQQIKIKKNFLPLVESKYQIYIDLNKKIETSTLIEKLKKNIERLIQESNRISSDLVKAESSEKTPTELIKKYKERIFFIQKKKDEIQNQLSFLKAL